MENKKREYNKFILQSPEGNLRIVDERELMRVIKNDDNKEVILGKLMYIKELTAFFNYNKELTELRLKQQATKHKLSQLVRSNIHLLANQTRDNFLFNFRELITDKL